MSARTAGRARVLVVVLAALCVAGGWLAGRHWPSADGPAPGYLAQLTEALDLRPDQVAVVERLLGEEDRDLDALLSRGLDGIREDVAARRARTERDVLALLDPGQRRRYDELATAEGAR